MKHAPRPGIGGALGRIALSAIWIGLPLPLVVWFLHQPSRAFLAWIVWAVWGVFHLHRTNVALLAAEMTGVLFFQYRPDLWPWLYLLGALHAALLIRTWRLFYIRDAG